MTTFLTRIDINGVRHGPGPSIGVHRSDEHTEWERAEAQAETMQTGIQHVHGPGARLVLLGRYKPAKAE